MYVYTDMCICMYIYIYIYTHTYIMSLGPAAGRAGRPGGPPRAKVYHMIHYCIILG